jgi:hypothetical protein
MALPTLTLDDRTFDQLFELLRKQIDTSEWVDHNYSDSGIVLLDLLCWIGEMILYQADRVPPAHIEKFAALILDPPEPVTAPLTLEAAVPAVDTTVPIGSRFATNFFPATPSRPAHRFVFETLRPVTFRSAAPLPEKLTVTARELLAVENEALGVSDGQPDQTFPLRPVHALLGLPLDQPTPVLVDFVHRTATYNPNPQVTVGGVPWELKRFLKSDQSFIDPVAPAPRLHYMVDPDGRIRFGDDRFGSIPPAGAAIVCTRYQLLQGPSALIGVDALQHQLDPVAGLSFSPLKNGAAEGADFFFAPADRIREGLRRFRRPSRLITGADFESVLQIDFNELQDRAGRPEKILRAVALMNGKPSAPATLAPGHVTIVLLATSASAPSGEQLDQALTNPAPFVAGQSAAAHLAQKQALVIPGAGLVDLIGRFLDKRRLITTRIHLAAPTQPLPTLVAVSVTATVIVDRDRSVAEMTDLIVTRLRTFLGVTGGGVDRKGWPLGVSVHRSTIFRLLEDIDGVDHVQSLALSPADANGDVPLQPLELPAVALNGLSVSVLRA